MSPSVDDTGQQFIDGRRRHGSSSDPLTVANPSNGDVVATDTLASVDDVDEAVTAAKAKPAELTPTSSVAFAEAAQRAGIPDGVINVVTGRGPVAGEALVTHRDVAMVSFTGSTSAGSRVGSLAAGLVKRVHLELGGKAPFVVFDDADLEAAARGAVAGS